jgi:hypothetical protein
MCASGEGEVKAGAQARNERSTHLVEAVEFPADVGDRASLRVVALTDAHDLTTEGYAQQQWARPTTRRVLPLRMPLSLWDIRTHRGAEVQQGYRDE